LLGALLYAPALVLAANGGPGAKGSAPASAMTQQLGFADYAQVFLGLFVVLGVIVAMAWALRRMGRLPGAASGALRVVGGLSVGQRERVVLIQAGEKQLLVGVAPGRVQTLHVLEEPIDMSTGPAGGKTITFGERLNAAMKGRMPS